MNFDTTFFSSTVQAYSFFALIGVLGLVAGILFFVSMRAQRKYNRDALPFIPEIVLDAPPPRQEDEEERTDVVTASAFDFEEDDETLVGESVSANLLKDLQKRTDATSGAKKAAFNPFAKK